MAGDGVPVMVAVDREYGSRAGGHTSRRHAVPYSYSLLFRTRSIMGAYLSVLLSAVPLGMITLGLVLSVQAWTGSLALAGSITAMFTFGNAVGLAVQGALLDRAGDRVVVLVTGLVSGTSLAVVAAMGSRLPPLPLGALVLVTGLAVPAITAAVRRRLPVLVADPTARSAGYAMLSVIFQLAFAVGPLLVSLGIVLTGRPSSGLLVAAVMLAAAPVIFGLTAAPLPRPAPVSGESVIAWRWAALRRVLPLYAVATLTGIATGMTTVAIPAVTRAAGATAAAGPVFAAAAVGEVVGAVIFGSRTWPLAGHQQLPAALLAAAGMGVVVFTVSQAPALLVVAVGLGGAIGAPVTIRMSSLLDHLAGPETLGLAYAVLVGTGLVAAAAGTSVAGQAGAWLSDPRPLLLGPPVLLLLAAAATVMVRRALLLAR